MGGTDYEIILTDDRGAQISNLTALPGLGRSLWFDAPKAANRISYFWLGIPPDFDERLLRVDYMVQFWRRPRGRGGVKRLWQVYFVRKWRIGFVGEKESFILSGPDPKDLLRRRHTVAFSGTKYSEKTGKADDVMKEFVTQSQSDSIRPLPASGTRTFPDFSTAPDVGLGPTIEDKVSKWGRLLHASGSGLLPDIAEDARNLGGEVFFDVVPINVTNDNIDFQFVTNVGQPGQDVSDSVIFAREFGNLRDPSIEIDYTGEENYCYIAGTGRKKKRRVSQVSDTARINSSRFNRCEVVLQDTNLESARMRRTAGRAVLERGRPRVVASGIPLDTKDTRFGTDWNYGSKVTFQYRGYSLPVIVRAATPGHEGKRETVDARLEYSGEWPL